MKQKALFLFFLVSLSITGTNSAAEHECGWIWSDQGDYVVNNS